MGERGQGRGKGQPTPASSKSESTMTTRSRRKKEDDKRSRKEEQSKRLRMALDHDGGPNNDIVLPGPVTVKWEASEPEVKMEVGHAPKRKRLEVEIGSGPGTGHLPAPREEIKTEIPGGTLQENEIVVKEEVDIPNDGHQEEELGEESNLLPEEPVLDNNGMSSVVTDFGTVRKENEELKKLLQERDLEIKRLRDENEKLKLSSSHNRQVSSRGYDVASNVDTGGLTLTAGVSASIATQCCTEDLQASPDTRIKTLEIEIEQLRTCLEQKEGEKRALPISQLEGGVEGPIGASGGETLDMETMEGTPEKKILQLLPDVLKIIIHREPRYENCVKWRDLMPLLTKFRLVCKSLKESVGR